MSSHGALRMSPCQKYSFTVQVWLFTFLQPHPWRSANRWETTNSKPHGPIVMSGPFRSRDQQSDHIYYTLLSQVQSFGALFTSLSKLCKHVGQAKTIFTRNGFFWVLSHEVSRELSGFLTQQSKENFSFLPDMWKNCQKTLVVIQWLYFYNGFFLPFEKMGI